MKRVIQEYGSMAIAILGCVLAIGYLMHGIYLGTSGEQTKGIMSAIGKEATFKEDATTPIRGNIVQDNSTEKEILVRCKKAILEQENTKVEDIFFAEYQGKKCPIKIQHIYNSAGEDIVKEPGVIFGDDVLCLRTPGNYSICIVVKEDRSTKKIFDLYVI